MANETYNETAPAAVTPATTGEARNSAAIDEEVPVTADFPELPELRAPESVGVVQAINWRAALSAAGLAAFLAAVAGIGCGAEATIRKPSPAVPLAGSTPTLSASAGRNFGQVAK